MAASAPHTIKLRAVEPIRSEGAMKASEAIKPGMLVERHTDGTIKKHATAAAPASPAFAAEADIWGRTIDDAYLNGETVLYDTYRSGDWVYAFLSNGTGQDVGIGALLESAGNGLLRATTFGTGSAAAAAAKPIARALEAIDNDPGSAAVRIKVEIL